MQLKALRGMDMPDADTLIREEQGSFHRGHYDLEWQPVIPGTVRGRIGPFNTWDDMDGHLVINQLARAPQVRIANINYNTGAVELEPSFRSLGDRPCTFSYNFDERQIQPVEGYQMVVGEVQANRGA